MRFTTKLLPSRSGNLGILQLNNPKALHALSIDMIYCFQDVLKEWHKDDSLKAILLKASDDAKRPAFCSGGDVKRVYEAGLSSEQEHGWGLPSLDTSEFFRQEYIVNHAIATGNKTQVSLWDGVVMGGGVGISIHGKYRVSTEHTLFAMPETAIGLFPDVGSMYWMPRLLPKGVARYLALTGARLKAPDLLYTGLATHHVPSKRLGELQDALVLATQSLKETETVQDAVAPVLMSFHEPPKQDSDCFLASNRDSIDATFDADRVEDVVENLEKLDNDFAKDTLATLHKMSPTSMKVTLEGLRRGALVDNIGEDLIMEFRMAQGFMRPGSDFYRGIRAVLVDKDGDPQWEPATLEEVTDEMVQGYFQPLGEHDWKVPSTTQTSNL